MNRNTTRQVVNVLAYAALVVVNVLANALPLNGQTTGEISDRFPVFFVPAGFTFAIWGVIYLFLGAFTIYQALPAQRDSPALQRVGYLFALSAALNIAWLFLWHYNLFGLTLVAMVGLLVTLIAIYLRLDVGRAIVSRVERWLVHVPFSIYLGWITVATIANVTDVLYWVGWGGFGIGGPVWAAIMLVVGAAVTLAVILTRTDVAYTLAILWAYLGIAVKQSATPLVAVTAEVAMAILAVALAATMLVRRRRT